MTLHDRRYLVVGGSHGIGEAVVRHLVEAGADTQSWSRSAPNSSVAGVTYHTVDVTDSEAALPEQEGWLHGLVYCPGTINLGSFQKTGSGTEDCFYSTVSKV
jgi:3-oxoacyl-[acyl-carrier protein] reductase